MRGGEANDGSLERGLRTSFFWVASFAWALTFWLASLKLLRGIAPGDPLAVGRITVDGYAKQRDYLGALLFYLLVPLLAFLFRKLLDRWFERIAGRAAGLGPAFAFSLPFWIAPLLYLTTRKELWGILLPPVLAAIVPGWLRLRRERAWMRDLERPELAPFHLLVLTSAFAWVLFRAMAAGTRIAHIPTLFLEIPFIAFFMILFWAIGAGFARAVSLVAHRPQDELFARFALATSPLLLLPVLGLLPVDPRLAASAVALVVTGALAIAMMRRGPIRSGPAVRRAMAWIAIPILLFVISWASVAHTSDYVDLFHRGESLGPASDYLRGDVPYVDVFVLHGMLEDGLLDSWLMELFGRSEGVAHVRGLVLNGLTMPALWILALLATRSIPLSLAIMAAGYVTFADNQRVVLEILTVAAVIAAARTGRGPLFALGGTFAGAALLFSLDIGLYSIAGAAASVVLTALPADDRWRRAGRGLAWLGSGLLLVLVPAGAALAAAGALGAFLRTSFVEIPRAIDPVWSLPFPNLGASFRGGLDLRGASELLVGQAPRFALNPLVLGTALLVLLVRWRRRLEIDPALVVLVAFGLVTQRSALGRADFHHQYFSAFLIAPLLVLLAAALVRAARARAATGEGRWFLAAVGAAALPLAATALWVPDLLNARIDSITSYRARLAGASTHPRGAELRDRITAVTEEIQRRVPAGEPIFDFSNQPAFYFFADRPNPTRFYQIPIASPLDWQNEILADLARTRPRVVLRGSPEDYDRFDGISNDLRAAGVASWLDRAYEFRRNVRGVEIWELREDAPRQAPLLTALEMPLPADAEPSERVVFPSVGSAEGADGSFWTSALLVHNPHESPLRVHLRYTSNRGTAQRTVTVAPSRVLRFDDFAESIFGLPGSVGALMVRYPAARKPVLRVETRDASRDALPPPAAPLTQQDAAEAGTGANELRIVGLRGGGPRRVNAGVVNVGIRPVHVRVVARSATGAMIGEPVEWGLGEDESWTLVDAGTRLGAPIDGTTVIHVEVLSGRAVAWGAVIDQPTGMVQMVPGLPAKRQP